MAAPALASNSPPHSRSITLCLPQDLSIEVLSYLDLCDSNHLAHVAHSWLAASRVERRRIVQLEMTYEMAEKFQKVNPPITVSTIIQSPLSRLITHINDCPPFKFDNPESITRAVINFPNLLSMAIELDEMTDPLPVGMKLFQLPPRLTSIYITCDPIAIPTKQQQIYLDALASATQLQTVFLIDLKSSLINLTVLTSLTQLTDLTIHHYPASPMPDHVLQILSSMNQLVTLSLGWCLLPNQWRQLHLPHLRYISLEHGEGPNCSKDLVPLTNTVMVKSLRRLRLRLDACAKMVHLSQLTQLEDLELWRYSNDLEHTWTAEDISNIHTAFRQLRTLTRLKINYIYTKENQSKLHLTELFAASPHLTALDLNNQSTIDLSFLRTPLAHTRLVELKLTGLFTETEMSETINGVLECQRLQHLYVDVRTSDERWDLFRTKLDSRYVLPALEQVDITIRGGGFEERESLSWNDRTGSPTHPTFRPRVHLENSNAAVTPTVTPPSPPS